MGTSSLHTVVPDGGDCNGAYYVRGRCGYAPEASYEVYDNDPGERSCEQEARHLIEVFSRGHRGGDLPQAVSLSQAHPSADDCNGTINIERHAGIMEYEVVATTL